MSQYLLRCWRRVATILYVGDDDQSIYSNGTKSSNILRFEKDFPGAKVVRLEQNYRSTQQMSAASHMIAVNQGRLGKTLWTEAGHGEPIRIHAVWDGESEARFVGDEIENLQRDIKSPNEIPGSGQFSDARVRGTLDHGVPYRVVGGPTTTNGPKFAMQSHIYA